MSKKQVTYVDASEFESICVELGVPMVAQAGFVKCGDGKNGRYLYVAKTKRVGRVDLSWFKMTGEDGKAVPGVRDLDGDERHGSVEQGIDFSLTQEEILTAFRDALIFAASLPTADKARASSRPRKETGPAAVGFSAGLIAKGEEARVARKALIERVAREKGATISAKTEAELQSNEELPAPTGEESATEEDQALSAE